MINLSPIDRHSRIALSFSGGKDSLAVVHLLRDKLDKLTIYHLDTGDLLPEMRESVERVRDFAPHFVTVNTDVMTWQKKHGLPTDLLPNSAHWVGQAMGEHNAKLVTRYACCYENLMFPLFSRVKEDGCTLLIRGTKAADMRTLPAGSGQVCDGIELWYPLRDWSNEDVFAYLQSKDVPLPRIYEHVTNSPECARCSAWWGERRASYLRKFHPALFDDYAARMKIIRDEISQPLADLQRELAEID